VSPAAPGHSWLPAGYSFLSGLPEAKRRRRLIMPAQVVIDDSGGKGQGPVFVLAGFIGTAEQWATFSERWSACLSAHPAIKYFKMDEAASLNGQFHGISRDKRDAKLLELARIIRAGEFVAFRCRTDLEAHKATHGRVGRPMADPYFWPFHMTIVGVCHDLIDRGYRERAEVIFDEHVIFGKRAAAWYPLVRAMLSKPEERLVLPDQPLFRDDMEFLPLQAADLAAWLIRRTASGLGNPFDWLVRQELRFIEMSARSIDLTAERMREHLDPDGRLRDVFMEEFGPIEDFPEELKELIGDYRARFERMNKKPLRGKPRRRSRSR